MTHAKPVRSPKPAPNPDRVKITALQAKRLASLAGVHVSALEGKTVAELSEQLRWIVDPDFFLFRRVCGQVVKTNPITGVDEPVPFATVHVMETECDLFGIFPEELPWIWFYPFFC